MSKVKQKKEKFEKQVQSRRGGSTGRKSKIPSSSLLPLPLPAPQAAKPPPYLARSCLTARPHHACAAQNMHSPFQSSKLFRSFFRPAALTYTFIRRATWIGRDTARTVVQFGKFKGRTFEEACSARGGVWL